MASFRQTLVDLGATSLWTCQEASGTLVDTISGNNGTATGSPTYRNGSGGPTGAPYGILIGGTKGFTVPDATALDLANQFSMIMVIRPTVDNSYTVLDKGAGAASGYKVVHSSSLLRLQTSNESNRHRQTTLDTTTSVAVYGFTWNGVTAQDFQKDGTADGTNSATTAMTDNNVQLVIGAGGGADFELYTLALFKSVVLSDANHQTIYDARNTADPSTNASAENASASAAAEF